MLKAAEVGALAHFALIAPPIFSHLRAMETLADALASRGHRATFVHLQGFRDRLGGTVAGFEPIAAEGHAHDGLLQTLDCAVRAGGPLATYKLVRALAATTAVLCRDAPDVLRAIGATAVIGDQAEPAAGLIAEALGLPHVSIAAALLLNRDPAVPPPFLGWPSDLTVAGDKRNRGAWLVSDLVQRPQIRTLAAAARRLGLQPRSTTADWFSPLAQIGQGTAEFDHPRRALPSHFHYVGTFRSPEPSRSQPAYPHPGHQSHGHPFPALPRHDGRPVVFASLGTLFGGRLDVFRTIAAACRDLGATLIVAHCGRLSGPEAASIGAAWVTDFAPMQAAMAAADVVVTHAGMNTTMDALAAGRPILALPIAFDQPGIAARIVRCGAGLRLDPDRMTASATATALQRLLTEPGFRSSALRMGDGIMAAGGVARAADVIEIAVATSRTVLRADLPQRLPSFAA